MSHNPLWGCGTGFVPTPHTPTWPSTFVLARKGHNRPTPEPPRRGPEPRRRSNDHHAGTLTFLFRVHPTQTRRQVQARTPEIAYSDPGPPSSQTTAAPGRSTPGRGLFPAGALPLRGRYSPTYRAPLCRISHRTFNRILARKFPKKSKGKLAAGAAQAWSLRSTSSRSFWRFSSSKQVVHRTAPTDTRAALG